VVSTALGAEGLPVVAGEHYLQAEDADGFAAAADRLAAWALDPAGGEMTRMIDRARDAVQPLFWPGVTERLVELYRSELGRLGQRVTA